mmetsp:Transcript_32901/g.106384  ORF Transcript_32901/g.106384 Transcript_32901/m.106384 type:complete len:530 (+) Transcript_32901:63-1652(+)
MPAAPLSRRAAARLAPLGAVGVRWSASAAVAVHRSPQAPLYPRNIAEYPNVIAHLGVGGFHRSHQAMYLHELLEAKGKEAGWALCGVGLMPGDADMKQKLAAQDFLYTVLSQGNSGLSATVVGSIMDFILVPEDPFGSVERLAAPEVKIVSMTVTEKGYCLSVDGILDLKNKLVEAELPVGAPPKSAWGVIYAALALRVRRRVAPFTIMSCDNMPGNGSLAQRTLFEFSSAKAMAGDVFAGEVSELITTGAVTFPSTMVDRITPATEQAHKDLIATRFGIQDNWPVVAEDFKQWVIEDNFSDGRPAWETVPNTLLVPGEDVHVYESMKLRLLNGSHSAMSYVSYLAGHRTVALAMADPKVLGFVATFLDEVLPTVIQAPGVDLGAYRNKLLDRFSNPHIEDTLLRLAEDGSQKLQTTMRPVLLDHFSAHNEFPAMATAIGGWIRFMTGIDEAGDSILGIKDPAGGERLKELAIGVVADPNEVTVGLLLHEYFGEEVACHPAATKSIAQAVRDINDRGMVHVLQGFSGKR